MAEIGTMRVKSGLAEMLKGGVIMDVTNADQARIAEDAGACAVMALERVPADIRRDGGVARMADPDKITRDPGGSVDPGHGQGAHRPLRRGADPGGARGRLHRRERGADAGGHGEPHRQVEVHRPVRLRLHEPRRGAPPDRRGRGDDPHEGRGGHGRHRERGHAHALGLRRDQAARRDELRRALLRGEGAARAGRARQVGRREREAAGRDLHRRRDRDSGRRGALHAARRGRRLRRLRDLQVDEPVRAREGDRRGDDALPGRRGARPRLAGPGRRDDAASRPRASRPKSCSKPAAGRSRAVRPARHSCRDECGPRPWSSASFLAYLGGITILAVDPRAPRRPVGRARRRGVRLLDGC